MAPSEYYQFTPQERQLLGIMDIAPEGQAGQIERYYPGRGGGPSGGVFGRTLSTVTNPGRAIGTWWSNTFGGGNPDWSASQLAAAGVPYYPEGSTVSQTLGPALEGAFGGPGGGGLSTGLVDVTPGGGTPMEVVNQLGYDPSYPQNRGLGAIFSPGTGVPTQFWPSTAAGVIGNALAPGLGTLLNPLTKAGISWVQHGGLSRLGNLFGGIRGPGQGGSSVGAAAKSGYYDPQYLRSIGYEPGGGTGSLWPGAGPSVGVADVGGYGVGGGGGSFFHDLGGGRGGPLPGATYGLGSFGGGNLGSFGGLVGMHMAMPQYGGLTLSQVVRQMPWLLPGLTGGGVGSAGPGAGPWAAGGGKVLGSAV